MLESAALLPVTKRMNSRQSMAKATNEATKKNKHADRNPKLSINTPITVGPKKLPMYTKVVKAPDIMRYVLMSSLNPIFLVAEYDLPNADTTTQPNPIPTSAVQMKTIVFVC